MIVKLMFDVGGVLFVDALVVTGYMGDMELVFGCGQVVSGAVMLIGFVVGGFIVVKMSFGVLFFFCGAILVVMFVVVFVLMRDIGFMFVKGGCLLVEMCKIAAVSIEYGWCVLVVKWLMVEFLVMGGVGIYGFYALQLYLFELYDDFEVY